MSTISVPLTIKQEEMLNNLIARGYANNKADAMRKAFVKAAEEEAVNAVLEAERDPRTLRGDLRKLAKLIHSND
jgi:Arc/MetJ-type ribon-helix-helix transcriptional regulator